MKARIALVSRELYPFGGGGIGEYISACARLLAQVADVTVFTSSLHEDAYRRLRALADPRLLPDDVEIVFVPEAHSDEIGGYFSVLHLYSARVLESLRAHYRRHGPDLIEFSDYLGEGAVTVQARRGRDPMLRDSLVAIRLHTSAEVCAVLDGYIDDQLASRMTCELERLALREADLLLWPGGDTLAFYRRFYGRGQLAQARRILNPVLDTALHEAAEPVGHSDEVRLRLLYLGRLERRKGVENLVRAVTSLDSEHIELDILGGDTDTAPLGKLMSSQLEQVAVGDERIRFIAPVPRPELPALIAEHDAVVLPSLWEAWPYVGLEALRANRPIIAPPVGGFTEIVRAGVSGWLCDDASITSLADTIGRLLFAPDEVEQVRRTRGPSHRFAELTNPQEIIGCYAALLGGVELGNGDGRVARLRREASSSSNGHPNAAKISVRASAAPLVSVVIPYYGLPSFVGHAVRSALAQTHRPVEVIVVNDGSHGEADWVLAELATRYPIAIVTQVNSGLGAARNFGISQARGRFVVPLDADNLLEPTFVARTLTVIEADAELAYVTSWSRYIDDHGEPLPDPNSGYQPLGNSAREVLRNNVAGDAIALFPRSIFDKGFAYSEELTSYEDWELYQQLHVAGRYGTVIPERLVRYRVRSDSMIREIGFPQTGRLAGELGAHRREAEVQWTFARG